MDSEHSGLGRIEIRERAGRDATLGARWNAVIPRSTEAKPLKSPAIRSGQPQLDSDANAGPAQPTHTARHDRMLSEGNPAADYTRS